MAATQTEILENVAAWHYAKADRAKTSAEAERHEAIADALMRRAHNLHDAFNVAA